MTSAPFPYFGSKRPVAHLVWAAIGDVSHYIEPFFGSGAVLLQRPASKGFETVNDIDGLLANFWRAVRAAPDEVAHHADWPVNEADLHARHCWLVAQREPLTTRLMGDPGHYDAQAAGWWVWGACAWIGGGWCSGAGPWASVNAELVDTRQLPHLSSAQGIKRRLPHLSSAQGINRKLPHLSEGRGINRKLFITEWFAEIGDRLRDVRVGCGDWQRVLGPSVRRAGGGVTGIFLDPPYASSERDDVYACESDVATNVLTWCREHGDDHQLRIVLAGYAGEHEALQSEGWSVVPWKAKGGYGSQGTGRGRVNATRERLWLSPHCVSARSDLFASAV